MSRGVNTRNKQGGFFFTFQYMSTFPGEAARPLPRVRLHSFVGNSGEIRGWLLPSSDLHHDLRFLTRPFPDQVAKN